MQKMYLLHERRRLIDFIDLSKWRSRTGNYNSKYRQAILTEISFPHLASRSKQMSLAIQIFYLSLKLSDSRRIIFLYRLVTDDVSLFAMYMVTTSLGSQDENIKCHWGSVNEWYYSFN